MDERVWMDRNVEEGDSDPVSSLKGSLCRDVVTSYEATLLK
jgi:hypothetical protein